MKDLNRDNLIDFTAVQAMSDEVLDRLLAEAGEVAIPADLSFNAQEIMRLAMESDLNQPAAETKNNVIPFFARKNVRRYAGLAAAFAILIGAGSFGMSNIRMGSSASTEKAADYQYTLADTGNCAVPEDAPLEAAEAPMLLSSGQANGIVEDGIQESAKSAEDFCRIIIERDEEAAQLLEEALEDPAFAEEFNGVTEGGRFETLGANVLEDSVEFMIYLYDSPQDGADGTGYAYNRRYITWIRK